MNINTKPVPKNIDDKRAVEILSMSDIALVLTDPNLDDNPIVYVNQAFEKLTGYSSKVAVGQNCRFLQNEETARDKVAALADAIEKCESIALTLLNEKANGETFMNALVISPIFASDDAEKSQPVYFLGMQNEVSKDRESDQLKAFEEAISEVQHRVKNHLAMILSLIRMKSREVDQESGLGDISRRIESLQLLYAEMSAAREHTNEDLIPLGSYLGRIANAIGHLEGRTGVRVNVDVEPLEMQTDRAARVGLVVSEILTNCMQHAFKDQKTGLVELKVTRTDADGIRVLISDDGVGMPSEMDWPAGGGLGGRIVSGLCQGLDATLEVSRGAVGTVFVFEVPGENPDEDSGAS